MRIPLSLGVGWIWEYQIAEWRLAIVFHHPVRLLLRGLDLHLGFNLCVVVHVFTWAINRQMSYAAYLFQVESAAEAKHLFEKLLGHTELGV